LKLLYLFIGLIILFFFLLISCQQRLIYFPRKYASNYQKIFEQKIIEMQYKTEEGRQTAFYLPPKDKNKTNPDFIWFLFGGNASLALDWYYFIQDFPDDKTGFLLLDYPGYGKSQGKASPVSTYNSSIMAFNELAGLLKMDPLVLEGKIGVLGHSLGAAIGIRFAEKYQVKKIILLAPFTSLKEMACEVIGKPLCFLLQQDFNNIQGISDILRRKKIPAITIFHGINDQIIPVGMSRKLKKHFTMIEYIELTNGEHNRIMFQAKEQIFRSMRKE
jgi:surfactin synthase thioesterase subunit